MLIIFQCMNVGHAQSTDRARAHIESIVLSKVEVRHDEFSVCSQYGCNKITNLTIAKAAWKNIISLFEVASLSSRHERALLAEYIARMEQYVGRETHTQFDHAGTFPVFINVKKHKSDQMDCIDESINTLSYLKILDSEGLINYHNISGLVTRGGISAGYPHTAVLLEDKLSSKKYVIDSWFFDNGRPAVVVPYELWKRCWKPDSL